MSVNQRIIQFINEVTVQDILKKTNLGQSLIYKLKTSGGATASTLDELFAGYPDLSLDWIFKGVGKMWKLENIGMVSEPNEQYNTEKAKNTEVLNEKEKDIVTETEKLRMAIRNMQEDILRLQVDVEKLKKKK